MDWLKAIIGDDLFAKVEVALDGKKLIVNDGSYIPRDKFNVVNEDNKNLKEQLAERDTQLEELKNKSQNNVDLMEQITGLQAENKLVKEENEKAIKDLKFNFALETELTGLKAKNIKAVKSLLDIEKIQLLEDGKTWLGLSEQIDKIKENDGYLFGEETLSGIKPIETKGSKDYKGKNPFAKETFNLTEQGKLLKSNPELAEVLKAQAKGN